MLGSPYVGRAPSWGRNQLCFIVSTKPKENHESLSAGADQQILSERWVDYSNTTLASERKG